MGEHNIPKFQLSIRIDEKGLISVHGPVNDKILCLGLLEIAKKIVLESKEQPQPNIIIPDLAAPKMPGN